MTLTTELEEKTTSGGRLSGVDGTADNDREMLLLSPEEWRRGHHTSAQNSSGVPARKAELSSGCMTTYDHM